MVGAEGESVGRVFVVMRDKWWEPRVGVWAECS